GRGARLQPVPESCCTEGVAKELLGALPRAARRSGHVPGGGDVVRLGHQVHPGFSSLLGYVGFPPGLYGIVRLAEYKKKKQEVFEVVVQPYCPPSPPATINNNNIPTNM
ncbi:hypothetical protein Hamer_G006431, partial [Homarus americanus]